MYLFLRHRHHTCSRDVVVLLIRHVLAATLTGILLVVVTSLTLTQHVLAADVNRQFTYCRDVTHVNTARVSGGRDKRHVLR